MSRGWKPSVSSLSAGGAEAEAFLIDKPVGIIWGVGKALRRALDRDGIRTITITEPFILSTSSRWQDAVDNDALARTPTGEPRRFDFYFGNTGLVDVFEDTLRAAHGRSRAA